MFFNIVIIVFYMLVKLIYVRNLKNLFAQNRIFFNNVKKSRFYYGFFYGNFILGVDFYLLNKRLNRLYIFFKKKEENKVVGNGIMFFVFICWQCGLVDNLESRAVFCEGVEGDGSYLFGVFFIQEI